MPKAFDRVRIARKVSRPTSLDYITHIFEDFIEFHGDRNFADDKAIVGGIASLNGVPVTVIGIQKGKTMEENIERNFGSPHPEGYRKALRLMKQAEKFNRPIICFINTSGAYCGVGAEERGQGEAIARNLFELAKIKVPTISIVIGEGGSGGALALLKTVFTQFLVQRVLQVFFGKTLRDFRRLLTLCVLQHRTYMNLA